MEWNGNGRGRGGEGREGKRKRRGEKMQSLQMKRGEGSLLKKENGGKGEKGELIE